MQLLIPDFEYNPYKENVSIIASAQQGKTEHAKSLAYTLFHSGFNVIIFDVHRKFTSINPYAVKRNLSDLTGKGIEILQPYDFTGINQMYQFFKDLCSVVYSMNNVVFFVDELHNWFKNKWVTIESLELLVRNCNNRHIGYVFIFQAPAEVPSYVLRNSHHRFMLYMDLPTDIDYMKRYLGNEVFQFSENQIPKYQGLYKVQGKPCQKFEVVKID